ncbi:MAG: O-antigen ligase family protein, partial [Methylobacter sp.]
YLAPLVFDVDSYRLNSVAGKSTVIGFLSQFLFAYILFFWHRRFRYSLLVVLALSTLLSFQRGMWVGLVLAIIVYGFSPIKATSYKIRDAVVLSAFMVLIVLIASIALNLELTEKLIIDRIMEFNPTDASSERDFQQVITNDINPLIILIGEGYGKYSPLNKEDNLLNLPDAPYHEIFNETGIIGLVLFLGMFLSFIFRAVKRRNWFQVYFHLHLLIALSGSRVLWYFPLNFLVFFVAALLKDDRNDGSTTMLRTSR